MAAVQVPDFVFVAIGHTSFLFSLFSFSQSKMGRLRILSICGLIFGLVYQCWVNSRMPQGQDVHLVIFWLAVFLLIHVVKLTQEARAQKALSASKSQFS
jgi:hypothetical protein